MALYTQSVETWAQFALRDRTTSDPILGIPASEVLFYYKKEGSLTFTEIALVDVVDTEDPQAGENFAHLGYGMYAVRLTALNLDMLGSFVWVAKQSLTAVQDFQTVTSVDDVTRGEDFIDDITDLTANLVVVADAIDTGFSAAEADLTNIQSSLSTVNTKQVAAQVTLDSIEDEIPSGITATFTAS